MNEKLSFDSLPDAISVLLTKADVIIGLLSTNVCKTIETSNFMDIEEALLYLEQKGYKMSKSTLFKLTPGKKIPCMKLGNKLRFNSNELDKWLSDKIMSGDKSQSTSVELCKKYIHKQIK